MITFSLFSQPYYNPHRECYYNIITMNVPPRGPLLKLTTRIKKYPLSPFKFPGECGRIQTLGDFLLLQTCVFLRGIWDVGHIRLVEVCLV